METWKFSKIHFVAFATNIVAISNEPYYIDTVSVWGHLRQMPRRRKASLFRSNKGFTDESRQTVY